DLYVHVLDPVEQFVDVLPVHRQHAAHPHGEFAAAARALGEGAEHAAELPTACVEQLGDDAVHSARPERRAVDDLGHEEVPALVLDVLAKPAEHVGLADTTFTAEHDPGRCLPRAI